MRDWSSADQVQLELPHFGLAGAACFPEVGDRRDCVTSDSKADLRPVPRIDHVMVLLGARAYGEASASGFLGDRFGRLKEKKADSSVAGQYSTLGVAGDSTLIELFNADMPGSAPLTGGLVFSFEYPGSSQAARALLDASGQVKYHHDLVKRAVEGSAERQPWYYLISVDLGEGSPLLLFLNEVTPEYFEAVGARPAADGALRRRDYLNAVVGAPGGDSMLMRDITGVTLLVRAERARRIADALSVFGYTVTEHAEGPELHGPDLTIQLRIDESALERITEIGIRLAEGGQEPVEFQFGETSRLVIETNATARWLFDQAS
jgi:hypothetical protein